MLDYIWDWFVNQPPISGGIIFLLLFGLVVGFVRAFGQVEENKKLKDHGVSNQVPPDIRGNPEAIRKWLDAREAKPDSQPPNTGEPHVPNSSPHLP